MWNTNFETNLIKKTSYTNIFQLCIRRNPKVITRVYTEETRPIGSFIDTSGSVIITTGRLDKK